MTQRDVYRKLWRRLLPVYDEREAKAIVRMVLEERFGLTLTDIVCGALDGLDASKRNQLNQLVLRLEAGEPVQYALGEAAFCGRSFHVEPGVLIPRPETQQLIALTEDMIRPFARPAVLDVGTGSGCIAISLALDCPMATVSAWDISEKALRIARGNATALHAEVHFERQDALHSPVGEGRRWDAIVSNPPYVMEKERAEMAENVLEHEPQEALFVPDSDPLCFYRAIARYGRETLRDGGALLFEINPLLAKEMRRMLETESYCWIEIVADEFGKNRFTKAVISRS